MYDNNKVLKLNSIQIYNPIKNTETLIIDIGLFKNVNNSLETSSNVFATSPSFNA